MRSHMDAEDAISQFLTMDCETLWRHQNGREEVFTNVGTRKGYDKTTRVGDKHTGKYTDNLSMKVAFPALDAQSIKNKGQEM